MNALIGCYSTSSDREYNAVVTDLGGLFVKELENRSYAFDQSHMLDDRLYSHEYHCERISLPDVKGDELLAPDDLVALAPLLKDLGDPDVTFVQPEIPFLVVVKDDFFFEFDAEDSWGNIISYFTSRFSLAEVRSLLHAQPLPKRA